MPYKITFTYPIKTNVYDDSLEKLQRDLKKAHETYTETLKEITNREKRNINIEFRANNDMIKSGKQEWYSLTKKEIAIIR